MKRRFFLLTFIFCLLIWSCSEAFDLRTSVNGPDETPLDVKYPTNVFQYETVHFDVSGGVPPYTYTPDENWPGTTDDGYIQVPWTAGEYTMTISDTYGAEVVCTVTVNIRPNYVIYSAPSLPTGSEFDPGTALSGSFRIQNTSASSIDANINWTVYASETPNLDTGGVRYPVATGTLIHAPVAYNTSSEIAFNGYWPFTFNDHYIIITFTTDAESGSSDNMYVSTVYTAIRETNYTMFHSYNIAASYEAGTAIPTNLFARNEGPDHGALDYNWELFASLDTNATADELVASGTGKALREREDTQITHNALWPKEAGTYYLIARISETDDIDTTNDTIVAPHTFNVTASIDYEAVFKSLPSGGVAGSALNFDFTLSQKGNSDDTGSVSWEVYIAPSNSTAGYTPVKSGSITALASGGSSDISVVSELPIAPGNYFVIVKAVTAAGTDDIAPSNNTIFHQITVTN